MAGSSRSPGNVKDKGESLGTTASQAASEAKGKIQETVSNVMEKAQDAASTAAHKAQDAASSVAHKAQDAVSAAGQKTDEALANVGEKMTNWAGSIREKAPQEGAMGTAATTVADKLQAGGQYLQQHGLEDMADDLVTLVRRYPMQSVLLGLGFGFLLGQTFSRR